MLRVSPNVYVPGDAGQPQGSKSSNQHRRRPIEHRTQDCLHRLHHFCLINHGTEDVFRRNRLHHLNFGFGISWMAARETISRVTAFGKHFG